MARDERVGFALRRLRGDDRSLALRAQVPHHNYDINTIIDKSLDFHYFSSATASPGPPPCATPMRTWRTARMEASQPSPMLLLYFSNHTLSMAISIAPMRSTTDPVANGAPSDLTCPQSNLHLTPTRRTEFSTERESGQDGEGAPFLPPIPEQEGVAPDEVIPTGPGSEGYAAVAARDPNEEKQAEPQRPNYSAVSEGSPDLGSSEDTSDHRQREEELSAKIRPKAKPLRLPKVCTTTKHMQIFPPSHPFSSWHGFLLLDRWFSSDLWRARSSTRWCEIC